jgi:hypothetical protein
MTRLRPAATLVTRMTAMAEFRRTSEIKQPVQDGFYTIEIRVWSRRRRRGVVAVLTSAPLRRLLEAGRAAYDERVGGEIHLTIEGRSDENHKNFVGLIISGPLLSRHESGSVALQS